MMQHTPSPDEPPTPFALYNRACSMVYKKVSLYNYKELCTQIQSILSVYGHITLTTPDSVRSAKLSKVKFGVSASVGVQLGSPSAVYFCFFCIFISLFCLFVVVCFCFGEVGNHMHCDWIFKNRTLNRPLHMANEPAALCLVLGVSF